MPTVTTIVWLGTLGDKQGYIYIYVIKYLQSMYVYIYTPNYT